MSKPSRRNTQTLIATPRFCIVPAGDGQAPHEPRSPIPDRGISYLMSSGGSGLGAPPPAGLRLKHSIVVTSFPTPLSILKYWVESDGWTIQGCLMCALPLRVGCDPAKSLKNQRRWLGAIFRHGIAVIPSESSSALRLISLIRQLKSIG